MAIRNPIRESTNEYSFTFASFLKKAIPNITTCGYITILWYQQSLQGIKRTTSDKKRLESVAAVEIRSVIAIEFSERKFPVFEKNDFLDNFFVMKYSRNPKTVAIFKTSVPNPRYGIKNVNWFCIKMI